MPKRTLGKINNTGGEWKIVGITSEDFIIQMRGITYTNGTSPLPMMLTNSDDRPIEITIKIGAKGARPAGFDEKKGKTKQQVKRTP
jgi:hypothetical protein